MALNKWEAIISANHNIAPRCVIGHQWVMLYIYTIWWYYKDVSFPRSTQQTSHSTWHKVFCDFKVWFMFCCCHCSTVCDNMICWTTLKWYPTILLSRYFCNKGLCELIILGQKHPAESSTNIPVSSYTNCRIRMQSFNTVQTAWSFIADDHISHIGIQFQKLSSTSMGCKHYVEDFNHG